jgi:hypothetical protein
MATFDAQMPVQGASLERFRAALTQPRATYVRWSLAALSVACAVLHFAFMGSHFSEYWLYGLFFAVVGWLQLTWAVAVVVRPSRAVVAAGMLNLVVIAAWALSRTVGVGVGPQSSASEAATFPDILATVLEGLIVIGAAVLTIRPDTARRVVRRPAFAALGIGMLVVALAVGATVATTPRYAGAHGAAGHSHGAGGGGHVHAATATVGLTGNSPCEKAGPPASEGQVVDSSGHFHRGPTPQIAVDEPTRLELQKQQAVARQVAEQFPTVADARRAGYIMSTPYVPCIGAHYTNVRYAVTFDAAHPSELLYDGINPSAHIIGLSYLVWHPGGAPEGFAGPNDHWHQHNLNGGLCIGRNAVVIGAESTSQADCKARGGAKIGLQDIWMLHDWVVPGFECSWGVFASECPELGGRTGGTAWDPPDPSGRPIPQG